MNANQIMTRLIDGPKVVRIETWETVLLGGMKVHSSARWEDCMPISGSAGLSWKEVQIVRYEDQQQHLGVLMQQSLWNHKEAGISRLYVGIAHEKAISWADHAGNSYSIWPRIVPWWARLVRRWSR